MNRRAFLRSTVGAGVSAAASRRTAAAQVAPPWDDILARMSPALRALVGDPAHEVQLLYTRIDRDADQHATLSRFPLVLAPERWFAAASWVKLPAVLLTAERLTARGATATTSVVLGAPPIAGNWDLREPLDEPFERAVRRLFTVSENVPFNRLYEYLGQDEIADALVAHGYPDARVIGRLGSSDRELNRQVGETRLVDAGAREIDRRPARRGRGGAAFPHGPVLKGRGWKSDDGSVVDGPHDFSRTNYLPIESMHDMLAALVFPDGVRPMRRWQIPPDVRRILLVELSRWPRESSDPVYDVATYPDGAVKFLLPEEHSQQAPSSLRMYSKSGQAYGYLNDCAYVVDHDRGVEFLLTATIHVNADGIYNDDRYEYEEVGLPFLRALGAAVLAHERDRPRTHRPRFEGLPAASRP